MPRRPGLAVVASVEDRTLSFCSAEPEKPVHGCRHQPRNFQVAQAQVSPQVPPEVWAADEQDLLLLLEPQEFLQGVGQLIQWPNLFFALDLS